MQTPTPAQQEAIAARGNVLVVAGAGAGKTRTLVERCLAWLEEDPAHNTLDQILMVTFTEAAGAEMRKRLRDRLEKRAADGDAVWAAQLALLETANIGTLHSFCYRLVRRHFYNLGLDPRLMVLAEDQTHALAQKSLDQVIEDQCKGNSTTALAVQNLVLDHGRGWDKPVRDLILRLHHYTQTLADPQGWFCNQLKRLHQEDPVDWRFWLGSTFESWRVLWKPLLERLASGNPKAAECLGILSAAASSAEDEAEKLRRILDVDKGEWPKGKKTALRKPLESVFKEAAFLQSLYPSGGVDPLAQDWGWVRPQMEALLTTAREFTRIFDSEKKRAGGLDFHDLEQCALRLLRDEKTGLPTPLADQWRSRFRLVFVDEYQDINAAQDAIIRALGGEGSAGNRFLVGDVKQSIYRFRLANPRIFLGYQRSWQTSSEGRVVTLSDNFRSHEGILRFVNALFGVLMRRELGGIEYDAAACLRFGAPQERTSLAVVPGALPPVELRVLGGEEDPRPEADAGNATDAELEAQWIAQRLLKFKQGTVLGESGPRPAQWSDMVILMRSPRGKVESFVKEFTRMGVPLTATRGGFYESLEIRDLISLFQVLDNPLQDYPLLAVLRSPLAGFALDDLAFIRAESRKGLFWSALVRWANAHSEDDSERARRVKRFLSRHQSWRRLTREQPLSRVFERVLDETHYADWVLTQDRGIQRRANVDRLLQLTRQFDGFQREGLFRFLGFVEGQQDLDVEPATPAQGDSVRLMSIHQSKGLEFPIVVLADMGKSFNFSDTRGKIILDEELGLCPQIKAPQARQFYPSLPFWMAQQRQKRETLGEELRLLYVAVTRAVERLVLVGTVRSAGFVEGWQETAQRGCGVTELLEANSFLDWVGGWLCREHPAADFLHVGTGPLISWRLESADELSEDQVAVPPPMTAAEPPVDEAVLTQLEQRLSWSYPHEAATRMAAKTSVSAWRREMADEEAAPWIDAPRKIEETPKSSSKLSAAERGSAHHAYLQHVSLDSIDSIASLKGESQRLVAAKLLTELQADCLDFETLLRFWKSPVGQRFLAKREFIRRELAFTAQFPPHAPAGVDMSGEFVVIQGVIDLCAILPDEIWLLDFKTDHGTPAVLEEKTRAYRPQLELYAQAIGRIHQKPVTQIWLHFLSTGWSREFVWGKEGGLLLKDETV